MPVRPTKPTGRYAHITGCWCAWAESGATPEECRQRIAEVPEPMREDVRRHVHTAWNAPRRAKKACSKGKRKGK